MTEHCFCGRFVSFDHYEKGAHLYRCDEHGLVAWEDLASSTASS